ncbi:MAG: hypothetical protein JWL99_4656 [Streptomyces oryziradicis]|nr:hypothetical protein [Actinacidiphila oryziradicis]
MTPPPASAAVIPRARTFGLFSRTLTKPLLLVLSVGLVVANITGAPVGMLAAGIACSMLWQARWLASQEGQLGGWLVCPLAPTRIRAEDPNLAAYRQVPFYIVRAGV